MSHARNAPRARHSTQVIALRGTLLLSAVACGCAKAADNADAQPAAATAPAAAAVPARADIGPLKVGDAVDVLIGQDFKPGLVTCAEGLTYFIRRTDEQMFPGRTDKFYQLPALRKPGAGQTLSAQYHDVTPDPEGGPIGLGQQVEYKNPSGWSKWRVARRLGPRYVLFPDDPRAALGATETWAGLDAMRAVGSQKTFAAEAPPKPGNPTKLADVRIGDTVEAFRRGGYDWNAMTVTAIDHGRYYVQSNADTMGAWVVPVNMRAVGSEARFEAENPQQFVGEWLLTGDAFFTTTKSVDKGDHTEKTMQLNSGAGQDAGRVTIKADGTYVVTKTAVYHDDAPGKWVKNPNEGEGGILLKGGDRAGKDLLVTSYHGGIYLQGWLRGPGKVGVKK